MSDPETSEIRAGGQPRRRRLLLLTVSAVVLIAIIGAAYVALQPKSGSGPAGTPSAGSVAQFSGTGDMTTDSFTVQEGWEIAWTTQASRFQMTLSEDGNTRVLLTREGAGSGTTVPRGSGTFQLIVEADGPWNLEVIQP